MGQWAVGDDDYRGSQLEMSIIKVSQFFGNLGKAKNTQWIQIFFVPVPNCDSLPKGTVCVSYIKTRSASAFWQKVTEVMEFNEPAEGIFKASFEKHSGDMGTYYSLKWDWRERQTAEELEQLESHVLSFCKATPDWSI